MEYRILNIVFCLLLSLSAVADNDVKENAFEDFFKDVFSDADYIMNVYPCEASADTVECRLCVCLPDDENGPVRLAVECNRRPDSVPPVVIAGGEKLEKSSESSTYSVKFGVETHEYCYNYFFYPRRKGVFVCKTEGLSFGGTMYEGSLELHVDRVADSLDKADGLDKDLNIVLIIIAVFVLEWFLFWLRFRKEGRSDFADFVLEHRRVPLTVEWAITHYGLPSMLFFLSACSLFVCLQIQYFGDGGIPGFFLWMIPVLFFSGIVSWRSQTRKLYFRKIDTFLGREDIYNALAAVGEQRKWTPDHVGEDCIVAHTNPSIWSMTFGEQIFLVFDEGCVWVNSVNDMNKRTCAVSFGYTKRNIRMVEEAIRTKEKERLLTDKI